jgi:hypothetical protein
MPRIPPKVLDIAGYLYPDEESARVGSNFGGTAFLVGVPSRFAGHAFYYAISNWHTACRDGASVLRINTHHGGADVFPFMPEEWQFDPKFDVAAIRVPLDSKIHRCSALSTRMFALEEDVEREQLGPGENVFMIERFVDQDGGPINRPAVRFGNISVMPSPIKQPNGVVAYSYCIDLHSRSGYSGSPVFVYRTPGYDLEEGLPSKVEEATILFSGVNYLALLGIHFAQFPEKWELVRGFVDSVTETFSVPLIRDGEYVKGLSGMTCVLPSWYILEVLNLPHLKQARERGDAKEAERREREGSPPEPETNATLAEREEPL